MKNILLVDDDNQVRTMIAEVLESEDYNVVQAIDGEDALVKMIDANFDLVITDILMPRKEGLQTILDVRKKNPEVKIIAMSGGSLNIPTDFTLPVAKNFGATVAISKPIDIDQLLKLIEGVLSRED